MNPADHFAWFEGWPLLLAAPLYAVFLHRRDRRRDARVDEILGPRRPLLAASVAPLRRRCGRVAAVAAFGLTLLALLQPLFGYGRSNLADRGVDILVCLDVSRSMLAADLPPNRLEFAKSEIRALARRARGDRVGLIAFAGDAVLLAPLTRDAEALATIVDTAGPLSVEVGGTDIGMALDRALRALERATGHHEVVVLMTDGEDLEGRGRALAESCSDRGVAVHAVGLGSIEGTKIAIRRADGAHYLRDRSGQDVTTELDRQGLAAIAAVTGGVFVAAAPDDAPLTRLYDEKILPMARKAFESEERRDRVNRFQWPLFLAVIFWVAELALSERRRS